MDKKGVLNRVLRRIPLQDAIDIIKERINWTPAKKPKKKDDVKDEFLSLENVILDEEIEDFVQMAVMKRSVGLPAYTYKIKNIDFLDGKEDDKVREGYNITNDPFGNNRYTISVSVENNDSNKLVLNFRVKEYEGSWKTGIHNAESLSAVFTSSVSLNKELKVTSVFSGNHEVQEIIVNYLSHVLKWPLSSYRIREFTNQSFELGNASFKTSVLLDLIYNRLIEKGIQSAFKEIKFFIGGKSKRDGIRDVTIGGRDLLYSQLACEHVTRGSDIIAFKADMIFDGTEFSTIFYLKGKDLDVLKIVIVDTDNEEIKRKSMDIIQNEYIDMCNNGIKDMKVTKSLLDSIYKKFMTKDKLMTQVIEENALQSARLVMEILGKLNEFDEDATQYIKHFVGCQQTILDTVGYNGEDDNLGRIAEFVGFQLEEDFDESDYDVENLSDHEKDEEI